MSERIKAQPIAWYAEKDGRRSVTCDKSLADYWQVRGWQPVPLYDHAALIEYGYIVREECAKDAERYRRLRSERPATLLTLIFGNGCVNKTLEDAEQQFDAAIRN